MSVAISVIVTTPRRVRSLDACLHSLRIQDAPVREILVVENASERARRAGEAAGAVLAFVDGDVVARAGWSSALTACFEDGAALVSGPIEPRELGPNDGFLPSASANLAVRRDVFAALGGFDPAVGDTAVTDLSYRAALAGHRLVEAAGGVVVRLPPGPLLPRLTEQVRAGRDRAFLDWKYQRFLYARVAHRESTSMAATAGSWVGRIELLTGPRRPPVVLFPADATEGSVAAPLPPEPDFVMTGDAGRVQRMTSELRADPDLAVAPATLIEEAVARWDEPAPWSLRLVRLARATGWRMPVEPAARRLESTRPDAWGEAFTRLHAVHAWLHGCPRFVVAAPGPAGERLAGRLAPVRVVVA